MKKYGILMLAGGLLAISGSFVSAHATATTTTTQTTEESPAGTTTTTETTVQAPPVSTPAPAVPVEPESTRRDAITGAVVPVDEEAKEEPSLRDQVRAKIKDEAKVKP